MGSSSNPAPQDWSDLLAQDLVPPRTPGTHGRNDHGDPDVWSLLGDLPGSQGYGNACTPFLDFKDMTTLAPQKTVLVPHSAPPPSDDADVVLLASVIYGEAGSKNVFEEMAAIANTCVHRRDAMKSSLYHALKGFALAMTDGNHRVAAFRKATPLKRAKNPGMADALRAARNALQGGTDYSNGAFFWDGKDIQTNYAHHFKVKQGIHFTDPSHNIYKIPDSTKPVTTYRETTDAHGKKVKKERGHYDHIYDSTAAYGGSIFWKYNDDFLKATGNSVYN